MLFLTQGVDRASSGMWAQISAVLQDIAGSATLRCCFMPQHVASMQE